MKSLLFLLYFAVGPQLQPTYTTDLIADASITVEVEPLITRSTIEDDKLMLVLANLERERTIVQLRDLNTDEIIFNERVNNHNGYRVSLNLERLEKGRYVIAVRKGDTLRRQVVVKSDTGIVCSDWK